MAFPAAYLFFYVGLPASWGYWAMIIFSVICLFARLQLLHEILPNFSTKRFCIDALLPIIYSVIPVIPIAYYMHPWGENVNMLTFMSESLACIMLTSISIWILGLSRIERHNCITFLQNKICRLRHD